MPKTQVWVMPADAGEAEKLTDFPGGVVDFDWSPDGKALAVIAKDPELAEGEEKPPQPKPIVIDRYQFKQDFVGLLSDKRQHLYVFDVGSRKATQLTSGAHDEHLPAWSPDGNRIAYVTKRGPDPDRHLNSDIYVIEAREGAPETQVTRFRGCRSRPGLGVAPGVEPGRQAHRLPAERRGQVDLLQALVASRHQRRERRGRAARRRRAQSHEAGLHARRALGHRARRRKPHDPCIPH